MRAGRLLAIAGFLIAAIAAPLSAKDEQPIEVHGLRRPALPAIAARLGDEVTPRAVTLDLTLDPAKPRFEGMVQIALDLHRPIDHVDLHGRDLSVGEVELVSGGVAYAGNWEQRSDTGLARITFAKTIAPGSGTLVIHYSAAFNDGPTGMFRAQVDGEWYSWTQFQSIDARAAFPCFDEPRFKTPWSVTMRLPPGLVAVSNGPELASEIEDGREVHRFATTAPLSSYLVAIMAGPFVVREGLAPPSPQRAEPLPMRILSTRQNAGKLDFALASSARMLALFEECLDEPFPFPKFDQVTSPLLPGAMENAGAALYRDDLLVLDEHAPVAQLREFGRVVAHELAHQWFGNLVTPHWWDDLWLSESFATAMGYQIGNAWRPDLNLDTGGRIEGFAAMETDALVTGRSVQQAIEGDAAIDAAFDPITYGKGGQVIAMLENYLGPGEFVRGVRRYISAHRFGTATSEQLFAAIAEEAGDPRIIDAARSFLRQQGVPLLSIRREGNRFRLSQRRYAPYGVAPDDTLWTIPLCARRDGEKRCVMITSRNAEFDFPGSGPMMPNAGGAGYYRFEFAEQDWEILIRRADRLSGGEALALVDSLKASILAGRGTIEELVRLGRVLRDHPDSEAADAVDRAMSAIVRMGIVDAHGRWGWRIWRQRLYVPLFKRYGLDVNAGAYALEPAGRTRRRVHTVSALVGTPAGGKIRTLLLAGVNAYLAGDKSALDEAWLNYALDIHLSDGGEGAVAPLVEQALASDDPVFRPEALSAASRTGRPESALMMLNLADPRLRDSERQIILDAVMARSSTRELGYEWIRGNLDTLLTGSSGVYYAARLPRALGTFCSEDWARRLEEEMRPRFASGSGAVELERSIERVRNCGVLDRELGKSISEEFAKLR
jgi:hypothetical protein